MKGSRLDGGEVKWYEEDALNLQTRLGLLLEVIVLDMGKRAKGALSRR
jgi:hypothetical protein